VVPEDGATVGFLLFGVPRNSAHANAAKLFINTVMSEQGQKIVYETHFTDHHELHGSQSARTLESLKARGAEPLKIDVRFVAAHPELRKLSEELAKILRQ
jgi:ABC-type Fe3+ transport system substrate-binding protein